MAKANTCFRCSAAAHRTFHPIDLVTGEKKHPHAGLRARLQRLMSRPCHRREKTPSCWATRGNTKADVPALAMNFVGGQTCLTQPKEDYGGAQRTVCERSIQTAFSHP